MTDTTQETNAPLAQFEIQTIFVKDVSFKAPHAPHTFLKEWKPEVQLKLDTQSHRLEGHSSW